MLFLSVEQKALLPTKGFVTKIASKSLLVGNQVQLQRTLAAEHLPTFSTVELFPFVNQKLTTKKTSKGKVDKDRKNIVHEKKAYAGKRFFSLLLFLEKTICFQKTTVSTLRQKQALHVFASSNHQ